MGDDGFDPCECLWGHEMAMRRLLNMLRNSQSDCTDTVCYTPPRNESLGDESGNLMFMTLCICFALFMYYMAPRNTRNPPEPSKIRQNSNDSNGAPPTPPPAAT